MTEFAQPVYDYVFGALLIIAAGVIGYWCWKIFRDQKF